jgi:hypothetical protein
MNEINLGGNYHLKINSKKLKSGKCQVKFSATVKLKQNMYGYVLADSGEKLNTVVEKIILKLDQVRNRDNYHHINLYRIGQSNQVDTNFMIFDS